EKLDVTDLANAVHTLPATRSTSWNLMHRGDSIAQPGHIMTVYSDKYGDASFEFYVIHAFGNPTVPKIGISNARAFSRKVTVSDVNKQFGPHKPVVVSREILW